MNTPEKIAATYLRLNGFLLLQHFTVLNGDQHNHVDLIGYRPRNSKELAINQAGLNVPLDRDRDFSERISELQSENSDDYSNNAPVGIIVQVRGNNTNPKFFDKHDDYVGNFLGEGIKPVRIIFRCQNHKFIIKKKILCISLEDSYKWIQERIDFFRKAGSWSLSEEFLADLLFIKSKI